MRNRITRKRCNTELNNYTLCENQTQTSMLLRFISQAVKLMNYWGFRVSRTAVSTWLDCSRLMSDFSSRLREFIKTCFCLKTHRFLPLYVLGNRSKTLLLPIICKTSDLPTASRLRSDGTDRKSHRLNSSDSRSGTFLFLVRTLAQ